MAELVDHKRIQHLAHLAKLDLSKQEKSRFGKQLAQILDYMAALRGLKRGIQRAEVINKVFDHVRTDKAHECLKVDQVLKNAASSDGSYFKVKAIFE